MPQEMLFGGARIIIQPLRNRISNYLEECLQNSYLVVQESSFSHYEIIFQISLKNASRKAIWWCKDHHSVITKSYFG
uniref:Uncharacterized protein n=1 Tax=Romanomermis culicivorax TaxID=13658 RepID=A0A915J1N7_ROMCU